MQDPDILVSIDELAQEEHRLREAEGRDELDDREKERLSSIEVQLDQCWDLLRQRRARRSAGLDPDEADVRSSETVEHYRQ
jgi:Protein of unknown function (DUF2630)